MLTLVAMPERTLLGCDEMWLGLRVLDLWGLLLFGVRGCFFSSKCFSIQVLSFILSPSLFLCYPTSHAKKFAPFLH